jgi:glucose-1-phosphate thymidylyltransferase
MDAVYPWDLIRLNGAAMDFQGQQFVGGVEKGAILKGDLTIGTGSKIRSGCYIEGPVIIGEGCDIGPQVTIMPSTSIGDGVSIGPYSYIEESLIGKNVNLSSHTHLSHCVLDEGVTSGPGLQCPAEAAISRVDQEFFNIKNIGALVGENSTIGAGVVIEPGCIVGAGCKISSQARVSGILDNRSIVV